MVLVFDVGSVYPGQCTAHCKNQKAFTSLMMISESLGIPLSYLSGWSTNTELGSVIYADDVVFSQVIILLAFIVYVVIVS